MPNIRHCCIVGCFSNSRQSPHLQFFQFPRKENPYYPLWKKACHASMPRILQKKKAVLCALHFQPRSIGGRRLLSSAVPSLRLERPKNVAAREKEILKDEIEGSRKVAYINAVVFEWLVRANLNSQLRGSITHGMIKEKAVAANHLIGCNSFEADNRWLHDFRENHLADFAQKLSTNQLKPKGSSLWIPDIVKDMQDLFPSVGVQYMQNIENKNTYDNGDDMNDKDDDYDDDNDDDDGDGDNDDDEDENDEDVNGSAKSKMLKIEGEAESLTETSDPANYNSNSNTSANGSTNYNNNSSHAPTDSVTPISRSTSESPNNTPTGKHTNGSLSRSELIVESYSHALEVVKPLADFAIRNENFRMIALLDKLEAEFVKRSQKEKRQIIGKCGID